MADGVVGVVCRTGFATGTPLESFTVNRAVYGASTDFSGLVSFVESGSTGDYDVVFTPTVAGDYRMRWTGNASGAEFTETWRVVTAAQADPAAALAAASIGAPSAVASGHVSLVAGNDYLVADGKQLTFVFGSSPNLSGLTVTFAITDTALAVVAAIAGAGTATQTATVELTAVQTAALSRGILYRYALTTSGNDVLARGRVVVT
jgi:hypothetical protein